MYCGDPDVVRITFHLEKLCNNVCSCAYAVYNTTLYIVLLYQARKQYQDEQARNWFTEQMKEREQAKQNQAMADKLYELKQQELDQRAMDLQKAEEDCRRAINMATKDFNAAQVCVCVCVRACGM
jgi:hypothetical protein